MSLHTDLPLKPERPLLHTTHSTGLICRYRLSLQKHIFLVEIRDVFIFFCLLTPLVTWYVGMP